MSRMPRPDPEACVARYGPARGPEGWLVAKSPGERPDVGLSACRTWSLGCGPHSAALAGDARAAALTEFGGQPQPVTCLHVLQHRRGDNAIADACHAQWCMHA